MTNAQLFSAALKKIESKSIRDWANSDRNRPIWLEIAKKWKREHHSHVNLDAVTAFATYITATAIGL